MRTCKTCICLLALFAGLVGPQLIQAEQINNLYKKGNGSLPKEIEAGLSYVLELIQKKGSELDPAQILPLLGFVVQRGDDAGQLKLSKRESGNGACGRSSKLRWSAYCATNTITAYQLFWFPRTFCV